MTGKVARANVAIYIDGDSIWIETGGKLRVYGRRRFRDAGRTGRGEETRVATLPKISGRVLTLSGCARKTNKRGRSVYETSVPVGDRVRSARSAKD